MKRLKRDTDSISAYAAPPLVASKPSHRGWILAIAGLALAAMPVGYFVARPKPIDSLAVMPFVNMGADPSTEYLSDGITESLINSLSQLPKLRVVPRTLVSAYKGKETDPGKVGRDLHVRAILTGKVAQRGETLNLQTELVDVGELSQLWGQQYSRRSSEILMLQENIAKQVSEKLHLRPSGEEQKRLAKRYTENTQAYQLYLKGRYFWNRRTAELLPKANEFSQQAIEKDSTYGLAYAGLAQSYALFGYYGVQSPGESCPKAKTAAMQAIEIDESLAEAHAALGWIRGACDWDWSGSEMEYRRALELNTTDSIARLWHAQELWAIGRLEEALEEHKRALKAEPLSLIAGAGIARGLDVTGHYEQGIDQVRKTIEMDPGFIEARLYLGWVYEHHSMLSEAIIEFRQALSLSGGHPRFVSALAHAYAISGQRKMAEDSLAKLRQQSKKRYVAPYDIAPIYAGLNDTEQTFKNLEMSYEDRSYWFIQLRVDPRFDAIRTDRRYQDLLRRMHLEP